MLVLVVVVIFNIGFEVFLWRSRGDVLLGGLGFELLVHVPDALVVFYIIRTVGGAGELDLGDVLYDWMAEVVSRRVLVFD